ncbi:hypothetical protein CHH28_13950 [Bacterioplanes sanyensis]|uniref:UPF0276 protein CHH28_13950 n=1 Tax=Bacterioplanes sanyensis TaxID=1249553 RepID=A0A222FLR8_9GAMM|nr:DUF692 domain-containing protein [Bacterioplanes sanyensis]ASP39709.1 hypothetical protein CHH28_13950 [Bacterioplanes sanyensis]
MTMTFPVQGAGLGLRRGLMEALTSVDDGRIDFMEVAPENWMRIGGRLGKAFRAFTERYDFLCHGLSLSLGSPDPLDEDFVREVGRFLRQHNIKAYSEHLSYCSNDGHMYDLMPIPFTEQAVQYVAERIQRVQDILGQRLIIENVSAYAEPGKEMSEVEFVSQVVKAADCDLLLDVNNVYVNCRNHGGDARDYIAAMPSERIRYCHIAGHFDEAPDLLVDTHGMEVKDDVWQLLQFTYQHHGVIPTLLERDFNFPALEELLAEVDLIRQHQQAALVAEQAV